VRRRVVHVHHLYFSAPAHCARAPPAPLTVHCAHHHLCLSVLAH
jgi:hypothetical protein